MVTAGEKTPSRNTVATDFFIKKLSLQASTASDKSSLTHPVNINMFVSWFLPLKAIHVQLL